MAIALIADAHLGGPGGGAGPLVARGVAGTLGCVYEPFLPFSPRVDYFFKAIFAGNSFGEAAYMCQPALSWQNVAIGDPLYRPFRRKNVEGGM